MRRLLHRKAAHDLEALSRRTARLDRAARGRDDVLHDREPKTGPARGARSVGSVEALEQAVEILCGGAGAVIRHGQAGRNSVVRDGYTARAAGARIPHLIRVELL